MNRSSTFTCFLCLVLGITGCQSPAAKKASTTVGLENAKTADAQQESGPIQQAGFAEEIRLENPEHPRGNQPASAGNHDKNQDMKSRPEKITKSQSVPESILFQPLKYPRGFDRLIIEGQRVNFESEDGTKLDGRFFRASNPKGVIVYCHGNGGNLVSRAPRMQEMQKRYGYSVFLFDYRGYGRSEGKPTISGVLADGRSAVREAARLAHVQPSDVVVMGRSLGGAIAVQLANEFKSPKLIVESSFTSFRDIAKRYVSILSGFTNKKALTSEKDIAKYRGQVLVSHGVKDNTIPLKHGKRLYEAANEPKLFFEIEDAGHNDPLPESYQKVLGEFLKQP